MATINTKYTLRDVVSTQDDGGDMLRVVDVLEKQQELLQFLPMTPTNQDMSHLVALQTSRPSGALGRFNKAVGFSKATAKKVRDNISLLRARSRADATLFQAGVTNYNEWRFSQDRPIIAGMSDNMAGYFIYGDEASDSDEFNGLAVRYDALPTDPTDQEDPAYNVISAGGTGSDNASIWLARLAPDGVHGLYPKNGMAGLQVKDLGQQLLGDETNGYINYHVTQFDWFAGLTVEDWRQCGRICNIDYSDLKAGVGADLYALMMDLQEKMPYKDNLFWIMRRDIKSIMSQQQRLTQEQYMIDGTDRYTQIDSFAGVPILRMDALLLTEATIS
jgi:hypothetical protein